MGGEWGPLYRVRRYQYMAKPDPQGGLLSPDMILTDHNTTMRFRILIDRFPIPHVLVYIYALHVY